MPQTLQFFVLFPLVAFLLSLVLHRQQEKLISATAIITAALCFAGVLLLTGAWAYNGAGVMDIKHIVVYKSGNFEFFIDFYFDLATATFAAVGSLVTLLVAIFSKYYMHRDPGFKRFYCTLLLFFVGYNLVVFGGNFETLFIGWEILGICSFLLIAFYRDRYLPVKNGLKVISIYRLGDVCLILAMWMCHHIFHENITFFKLNESGFILPLLEANQMLFLFTAIMLMIAAAAKSALLPFSSWLPRAMEGPTTSSAVFYGSLSIHLGAFLLIRTYPMWNHVPGMVVAVVAIGILTSLVATSIARVQSTVKTQIAYASITQIGLIFVEVALGFHILALVHFAGNAFLRTYQLLVSPSVLSYRIHDMFFNFTPSSQQQPGKFQKFKNALYILSIKEWNLDTFLYRTLWAPFKWTGSNMNALVKRLSTVFLLLCCTLGLLGFIAKDSIPEHYENYLSIFFSVLGLLVILTSFAERGDARTAWFYVLAGQGLVTLSIALNEHVPLHEIIIYLGGVVAAGAAGYACLAGLRKEGESVLLDGFHGHSYQRPVRSFLFLVCCLALLGFPFTPTFLGVDLLFTHIHKQHWGLVTISALSFIFIELTVLRIYARVFLGPHRVNDHPIAFRSS